MRTFMRVTYTVKMVSSGNSRIHHCTTNGAYRRENIRCQFEGRKQTTEILNGLPLDWDLTLQKLCLGVAVIRV
jgi:hypothetical protein